ncbi:hypothetical protein OF83DRAFT_1169743 [Amylostereum chailletii]|nr:hypothetical protein OF83DRAFT_1169743 [Amylostereum chailletii]
MSAADRLESAANADPFIPPLFLESGLFGAYTLLIIQSTYILMYVRASIHPNPSSSLALAAERHKDLPTHLVSMLYVVLSSFRLGRSTAVLLHNVATLEMACSELNLILSDAVVIWRAWVLWGRNKIVLTSCAVLFMSAIAIAVLVIYQEATSEPGLSEGFLSEFGETVAAVSLFLSLAINLWATALIAYKAWRYRRSISAHLQRGNRKGVVETLLTLLLESGAIYSCFQISWVISYTLRARPSTTLEWVAPLILAQISGIYPTVVIVLVCFQKTHCDRQFTYPDIETAGARRGLPGQDLTAFEVSARSEPVIVVGPGANAPLTVYSDSESSLGDVGAVKSEA